MTANAGTVVQRVLHGTRGHVPEAGGYVGVGVQGDRDIGVP